MTSLFPPRESLVVTSRLGTGNSRTFFYGVGVTHATMSSTVLGPHTSESMDQFHGSCRVQLLQKLTFLQSAIGYSLVEYQMYGHLSSLSLL
jgi:hypothetical protein